MKQDFSDIFISYGRKESKAFAKKLHDRLAGLGYKVWFDQNDIPLGVDFQSQIDDGIENAHNFCYVIAPHAILSAYCLKEIKLALKLNKRIIPIMHIEPKEQELWDKMHPVISKLNWIYARQQENQEIEQELWKDTDDFEKSFSGLTSLIDRHKEYVYNHSYFLLKSFEWERNQKRTDYLLVGEERVRAESWLEQKFKGEQPPCEPTDLHCEYISESEKNANNLMTHVFLSYSTDDEDAMHGIKRVLLRQGFTVWTNRTDIKTGEAFQAEINRGIEETDNILFLLSPNSIISPYCQQELDLAFSLNKRIITLLIMPTPMEQIPERLRKIQFIDFTNSSEDANAEFQRDLDKMLRILNEERHYYQQHKVLLAKALKWKRQNQNDSILLRGYNLDAAKSWLQFAEQNPTHPPLPVHREFIEESGRRTADMTTEVFVSYSRNDSDFSRRLNEELQVHGKTTWFDQESIASASDFQKEIFKGIENSDNFVFVISPRAISSPYCTEEVDYAVKCGKRIVTVLYREVNINDMHPELAKVQWIDFTQTSRDFHAVFGELLRTLDTDRDHVQTHTKYTQRVLEWERMGKTNDLLFRGSEFIIAKAWYDDALDKKKKPAPTVSQKELIGNSEHEIFATQRKEKRRMAILRVLLIGVSIAFFVAIGGVFYARQQSVRAEAEAARAEVEKEKALNESKRAENEKEIAEFQKLMAQESEQKADTARMNAELSEKAAVASRNAAELEKIRAEEAKDRAEKSEQIAKESQSEAINQKNAAEVSKENAQRSEKRAVSANKRNEFLLYLFNAKEFASKSMIVEDADTLQALLALTALELNKTAANIAEAVKDSSFRVRYDAEITEALQNSLFNFEEKKGFLQDGEIWAVAINNEHVALSGKNGKLLLSRLETYSNKMPNLHAESEEIPLLDSKNTKQILGQAIRSLTYIHANLIAVGTSAGRVMLCSLTNAKQAVNFTEMTNDKQSIKKEYKEFQLIYNHHNQAVLNLLYVRNKNLLVSSGMDKNIHVYNLNQKKEQAILKVPSTVKSLTWTDKNFMVGCDSLGNLIQWNLENLNEQPITYKVGRSAFSVAYHQKHKLLAVGLGDGEVICYSFNPKTNRLENRKTLPRKHKGVVTSLAFSGDGEWLASGSLDETVILWSLEDIKDGVDRLVPIPIENESHKIFSVAFDASSNYLLFGDNKKLQIIPLNRNLLYKMLRDKVGKNRELNEAEWKYYLRGELNKPKPLVLK